jgi:hypothetical protein
LFSYFFLYCEVIDIALDDLVVLSDEAPNHRTNS